MISYEPEADGLPDPGEVVWGWVPFEEDPSQGKDRPSEVRLDRLVLLRNDAIRREGAAVSREVFDRVVAEARRYHAIS